MADGIDPAVQSEQATHAQSAVDRVFPQSESRQLRPRNDPMLPLREQANLPIGRPSLRFPVHTAGKDRLAGVVR
jgi:hypothetical protein